MNFGRRVLPGLLSALLLVLGTVWAINTVHQNPQSGIDDADIFLVYADNLAHGRGFVYNAMDGPVEGFSSLLWTLVCASVFLVGGRESGLLMVSAFALCGTLLLAMQIVRRETRGGSSFVYQMLYLLVVLSAPAYVAWMTITLMDTGVHGLALMLGLYVAVYPARSLGGRTAAGVILAALPLVRPEFLLLSPVLVAIGALRMRQQGREDALKQSAIYASGYLVVVMGLTLFRVLYFGYPLPNTFYAKVAPSLVYNLRQGREYLLQYVRSSAIVSASLLVLLLVIARFAVTRLKRRQDAPSPRCAEGLFSLSSFEAIAGFAVVAMAVPVLTGGDHFSLHRFFQPVYPLLCLVLVLACMRAVPNAGAMFGIAGRRACWKVMASACVLAPLLGWLGLYAHDTSWDQVWRWGSPLETEFGIAQAGKANGRAMARLFAPLVSLPSVGVITAGGIKREYRGSIIDLMGLNNVAMGHSRGNRQGFKGHAAFNSAVFYTLAPDIILANPPADQKTQNLDSGVMRDVFGEVRFQSLYTYGSLSTCTGVPESSPLFFVRKDFRDRLTRSGQFSFRVDENWSAHWVRQ